MSRYALAALLVVLASAGVAQPPDLAPLRDAIAEYEAQGLDAEDLVVRSNLPLARLKLRKAELLLIPGKYGDAAGDAARWEVDQGFAALARIDAGEVAYVGDYDGFEWPAAIASLAGGGGAPGGYQPAYYEYAFDADNDGSPQPFLVDVPPDYDPERAWPLIVYLHGYHGNVDMIRKWDSRGIADLAKEAGYLVVAPHGRSETDFVGVGEADVLQALREAQRYYNVDPERVYLSGGSMGGYGSLNLALRYPRLWVAAVANAAFADMLIFGGLPRDELLPFRRWHFLRSNPVDLAGNAPSLPIFAQYGGADTSVPPDNAARFAEARHAEAGFYEHNIVPGGGHAVCEQFAPGLEWLKGRVRDPWPAFVRHKTFSLRHGRSYWTRILDIRTWGEAAEIEARAEGNTITVTTSNVTAYELTLAAPLVDVNQSVRVISDGAPAFDGSAAEPIRIGDVGETPLRKTPTLCGAFDDIFNHPFLAVRGSSDEDAEWLRNRWEAYTDGWPRMKRDADVTQTDIDRYGLLLLGGPTENTLTARVADGLPVSFIDGGYEVDGREHVGDDLGLALVYPNPLNPDRYVAVLAGGRYGVGLPVNHPFSQLPDVLIFRAETVTEPNEGASPVFGKPNRHLFAAFFDSAWQFNPDSTWAE